MSYDEREDRREHEHDQLDLVIDVGPHLSHLLKRLFPKQRPGQPRVVFIKAAYEGGPIVEGESIMALTLTDVQKVTLSIEEDDAAGNPVPFTTPPVWGTSDATLLTVTADDATGKTATATAVGPLGSAQANVSVDGLTGTLDVTVTASAGTTLNISVGTPTAK